MQGVKNDDIIFWRYFWLDGKMLFKPVHIGSVGVQHALLIISVVL